MRSTEDDKHDADQRPDCRSAVSPRQFSLADLMGVTALFAMLFAVLAAFEAHPSVFLMVAGFVVTVWATQTGLFGGKNPRKAAVLTGSVVAVGVSAIIVVLSHWTTNKVSDGAFVTLVVFAPALGAVLGYAAGALIGTALLSARWVGGLPLTRRSQSDPGEEFSPDFSAGDRDGDSSDATDRPFAARNDAGGEPTE
ncbi:MAG: hypothetical protein HQ581_00470 [Planctomycetes bacterium]|nr:hypothetical protein [Planctomycetota bacterium]